VIGTYSYLPAGWGWTGGADWFGASAQPVLLDAGQVVGILVEVNQDEIALAQAVLDRADSCSAPFVREVLNEQIDLAQQLDALTNGGITPSPSAALDQIAGASRSAIDQFRSLSGADLGRAYVWNERTRAEQLLDLLGNQVDPSLADQGVLDVMDAVHDMLDRRAERASELASSCGFAEIGPEQTSY
jgi:predicted outer membrane protein